MVKDCKMKPNITAEGCKSCSDVVLPLCDVYREIKLRIERRKRCKRGKKCGGEKREREK